MHPYAPYDVLLQKQCHLVIGHTLTYTLSKFEVNWTDSSWDISIFVSYPLFFPNLTIIRPYSIWDMASEPTPQQLIIQSAQATANTTASALTARTASISLPIYDWDSQDAYHSFSIFCHTLENWLLLNCIPPDSEDHLRYVFAALGTKSLEMHAHWMPTGSKEEQKVTRWKLLPSLTESNREWHTMLTPMCVLENLKILWPGWERTPKISLHASRHWWTTVRWSMMSITSTNCIAVSSVHTTMRENSMGNLWTSHSRHPPASWLTLPWTTLPSNIPENKSPTAPNLWMPSTRTRGKWPTSATTAVVTHHLHPSRTSQLHMTALSQQSKLSGMWFPLFQMWQDGTLGTKIAMVASHSSQETYLHLGHSRGSPDAHLGTTKTAMGRVTKQTP